MLMDKGKKSKKTPVKKNKKSNISTKSTTKKSTKNTNKKNNISTKSEKKEEQKPRGITIIREETEKEESVEKYRNKLESIINRIKNQSLTVSDNKIRFGWK